MFFKFIHKDDIEKALKTKELILFLLQLDLDRPVIGIGELRTFAPGEIKSVEEAAALVENELEKAPESGQGIYYSVMLGLWDYSESPKYLVYMIEKDFDSEKVKMYEDDVFEIDEYTGKPYRYIIE